MTIKIPSIYGPVTEAARLRAAMNMKEDPQLRKAVEEIVCKQVGGSLAEGLMECKRRYPECYQDDNEKDSYTNS